MEYNYLGTSGLKVSKICLGTMTFGRQKGGPFDFFNTPTHSDKQTAWSILDRYVELGGNFIDTANMYTSGKSEKLIGEWLESRGRREDIVLATKVRHQTIPTDTRPNSEGLSRRVIIDNLTNSLERLKTDYIDLYQCHQWDNGTPIEETLRTFDDLVRCGKIRYYGCSNIGGWQMQKIVDVAKYNNFNPCMSLQQQYNLLYRDSEVDAFMVCQNEGVAVLPYSPLAGGLLTGKYVKGKVPDSENSRFGYMHAKQAVGADFGAWGFFSEKEQYWSIMKVLKDIADQKEVTPAQVAVRWLLQKQNVTSVVIGATSLKQLEENMAAGRPEFELTEDQMEELNEVSKPAIVKIYPYNKMWKPQRAARYNQFYQGSVKIPNKFL